MNMEKLAPEDLVRACVSAIAGKTQLYFDKYKDLRNNKVHPTKMRRW